MGNYADSENLTRAIKAIEVIHSNVNKFYHWNILRLPEWFSNQLLLKQNRGPISPSKWSSLQMSGGPQFWIKNVNNIEEMKNSGSRWLS